MWYVIAVLIVLFVIGVLFMVFALCKLNSKISRGEEHKLFDEWYKEFCLKKKEEEE